MERLSVTFLAKTHESEMSTAPRYVPHYTVDDYRRWEGDWQLIEGVPVAMTPSPFGRHERIVAEFVKSFGSQLDAQQCDCRVYAGLDWILSNDTVVRPDVMVVCGEQPDRHLERAPEVAVEVLSPSTRELDRTAKRELYHQSGVRFYLIVDPDQNRIERIRVVDQTEAPSESIGMDGTLTLELDNHCRLELQPLQLFR